MKRAAIRRELDDLRRAVQDEATSPQGLPAADDAAPLAGELAASFGRMVKSYMETFGVSQEETVAQLGASDAAHDERVLHGPPDQVQWTQLHNLAQRDPDLARRRWEEVKRAARAELQSGYRACRVMESASDCWDRAQFLAIRDDLADGLRPRNGLEWQLIDMLAQAQTMIFSWQETLTLMGRLLARGYKRALEEQERYEPPRLSEAEMIEQAVGMIERWHGVYLRTLKAFHDQRRHAPTVIVRRARQVNVGMQQVNVAGR
jgi:hypothetical protein